MRRTRSLGSLLGDPVRHCGRAGAAATRHQRTMARSTTAPVATTWSQVAALRLARQHLLERASRDRMIDVVRIMVGLQAQVTSAAELQFVARVDATPSRWSAASSRPGRCAARSTGWPLAVRIGSWP